MALRDARATADHLPGGAGEATTPEPCPPSKALPQQRSQQTLGHPGHHRWKVGGLLPALGCPAWPDPPGCPGGGGAAGAQPQGTRPETRGWPRPHRTGADTAPVSPATALRTLQAATVRKKGGTAASLRRRDSAQGRNRALRRPRMSSTNVNKTLSCPISPYNLTLLPKVKSIKSVSTSRTREKGKERPRPGSLTVGVSARASSLHPSAPCFPVELRDLSGMCLQSSRFVRIRTLKVVGTFLLKTRQGTNSLPTTGRVPGTSFLGPAAGQRQDRLGASAGPVCTAGPGPSPPSREGHG